MTRVGLHLVAALMGFGGVIFVVLYVLAVLGAVGEGQNVRDSGVLAGIGAVALIAAVLIEQGLARRNRVLAVRFPPLWISFAIFVLTLVLGGIAVWTDRVPVVEPFLVVIGAALIFSFVGRLVAIWVPGKRVPGEAVLGPALWGMLVATTVAVFVQIAIVISLIAAVIVGLAIAGIDTTSSMFERLASENVLAESADDLAGTATVSLVVLGLYAVIAPLTEELLKFLGVALVLRRRVHTRYVAFAAGVFAGLGFAVVETLGFALSAGEGWLLLLGIRAPVTLIHITGTSLVATGWYLQRSRGGFALVGYFAAAVVVHAAWNGLVASVMLLGLRYPDIEAADPAVAVAILAILGALGAIVLGCAGWIIVNARRYGREYHGVDDEQVGGPAIAAPTTLRQLSPVPSSFGSEG